MDVRIAFSRPHWTPLCRTARGAAFALAFWGGIATADQVRIEIDVRGEVFAKAAAEAQPAGSSLQMKALLEFDEVPAEAGDAAVFRRYHSAAADLTIDDNSTRTTLGEDAREIVVERQGSTPVPFLRRGYLTRDELDLLDTPFDPLLLAALLPAEPPEETAPWALSPDETAGLLAIDTVEHGGLEARIVEVFDGVARIALSGVVDGACDGVPTHLIVEGSFSAAVRTEEGRHRFHGPVDGVDVVIRERREASHVAPGFDVEARMMLTRETSTAPEEAVPPPDRVELSRRDGRGRPGLAWHRDAGQRFDLVYDSRWRIVEDGPAGLVMRFVDRGALVAQCSITALPRADSDLTPTINDLQRDIRQSLAGQFGRFEDADEVSRRDDAERPERKEVRVVSAGTAEGLPFQWIHYVVADRDGRRAGVTFMLEASLAKRFGEADKSLVAGLRFPAATPREARLPEKTTLP